MWTGLVIKSGAAWSRLFVCECVNQFGNRIMPVGFDRVNQ